MLTDIFDKYRMKIPTIDQFDTVGRKVFEEKAQSFMSKNVPIEFVMLGFPMKSPNVRDKVLGDIPDFAEEVAFQNLRKFGDEIKSIYSPGIKFTIASDGYVFNDIMGVSDSTVERYLEICKDMSNVEFVDLRSFYERGSLPLLREKVMQFGITEQELQERILFDPDVNSLYRGMIKFMTGDFAMYDLSKTQLQIKAKKIAREMMFRNEAYSNLVSKEFQQAIRLSIHPSQNIKKFSFMLISEKAWTSPWHAALLIDEDGEYTTIHRKDAEQLHYNLQFKNNQPYNYHA